MDLLSYLVDKVLEVRRRVRPSQSVQVGVDHKVGEGLPGGLVRVDVNLKKTKSEKFNGGLCNRLVDGYKWFEAEVLTVLDNVDFSLYFFPAKERFANAWSRWRKSLEFVWVLSPAPDNSSHLVSPVPAAAPRAASPPRVWLGRWPPWGYRAWRRSQAYDRPEKKGRETYHTAAFRNSRLA